MQKANKFKNREFSGDQQDRFIRNIMKAKIEKEKQQKWKQILEEQHHVRREASDVKALPRNKLGKLFALAASLALLISMWYIVNNPKNVSPMQLAEAHLLEPFPNPNSRKGTSDFELRQLFTDAYNEKDFFRAIEKSRALLRHKSAKTSDYFFTGLSYLYTGDSENAIQNLLQVRRMSAGDDDFRQESNWFLALSYLKAGDIEIAKQELERIISHKDWCADKAEKLLKQLP